MTFTEKTKFWLVIGVIAVLLAIAGYFYFQYWSAKKEADEWRSKHETVDQKIERLEKEYKDDKEKYRKQAEKLQADLEEARGTTIIKWRTKWRDRIIKVGEGGNEVPPSCKECFSEMGGLDYSTENTYVVVTDFIYWDDQKDGLVGEGAVFRFKDEFKKKLVYWGLVASDEVDEKVYNPRLTFTVDSGVKDGLEFPGIGLGIGTEVFNLEKCLHAEIGVNTYIAVTPQAISDSHLAFGLDWRIFPNISIGLAYGRSIEDNMGLINLNVFPY